MKNSNIKFTVIIPTLNEEKNIVHCIDSAKFADEIILIDSYSSDRTCEFARNADCKIFQRKFYSHGEQINWCCQFASNDWILVLDADERISQKLAHELTKIKIPSGVYGCKIKRHNFFLDRLIKHGSWRNDKVLRFFNKHKGKYVVRNVHSSVSVPGVIPTLNYPILHYSYRNIDDCIKKISRFSTGGALDLYDLKKKTTLLNLVLRSFFRFFKSYILCLGLLDGWRGLVIAFMDCSTVFFKYIKLMEIYENLEK